MARPRLGFREKIAVLVALPLAVVVLAGVPLLAGLVGQLRAATTQRDTVASAVAIAPLLDALVAERNLVVVAAGVPAAPDRLLEARARSVAATGRAREAVGRRAPAALTGALDAVDGPDAVLPPRVEAPERTVIEYGGRITALVEAVLAGATPAAGTTVDPLLRAGERRAAVEAGLLLAVTAPERAREAADLSVVADAAATVQWQRYSDAATGSVVAGAVAGPPQARVTDLVAELRADPDGFAAARTGAGPALLAEVSAAAGTRALATGGVLAVLARDSDAATATATAVAVAVGLVLLVAAILVVTIGLRIGNSVSRPLRRLAVAADTVADLARAELARTSDLDRAAPTFAAVNVSAPDELGELAASFNRVQAVAALLLERQVVLRRNSAAMLGHVGRRTRSLVARQLDLVTVLERGEQDPQRLERLYRLDHLTTRLRRNADALLVLADTPEDDIGAPPLPLADVLRAALASIEGYQRVRLDEVADAKVAPFARGDVTLLVAELLENAAAFSPPESPVLVRAVADRTRCRIEIVDRGVGMVETERADRNRELQEPGRPEQAPSPLLGLAVVGRIARRHDIRVALRSTSGGGTTAVVDLPRGLLVPAPAPAPGARFGDGYPDSPSGGMHIVASPPATRPTRPRRHRAGQSAGPVPATPAPDLAASVPGATAPGPDARQARDPVPGVPPGLAGMEPLLRRRVPNRFDGDTPSGRHQLVPPPVQEADRAATELDRLAAVPAPRRSDGHAQAPVPATGPAPAATVERDPDPAAPPGASGLRRRVPGAVSPPVSTTPLLGAVTDAEAERAFVEELQAGVARAVAQARAAADRTDREEQT